MRERDTNSVGEKRNYTQKRGTNEMKILVDADAVDFALLNLCQRGDIVVTQDYGVAAMILGKGKQI